MTQHVEAAREELPGALRNAVADTLDAHGQPLDGPGREELEVATARVHAKARTNIRELDRDGPLAYDGQLLVYSISRPQWGDLCDDIKVYAKARDWTARIYEHAADRVARRDPYVAFDRARERYAGDDSYPVVVAHPDPDPP